MGDQYSKSKRHSRSSSKSSNSSRRSQRPSRSPFIVDSPEGQSQSEIHSSYGESEPEYLQIAKDLQLHETYNQIESNRQGESSATGAMLGESSRSRRQPPSSSNSSNSSRRSQRSSRRPPSIVEEPKGQSRREMPKLYGESGNELSVGEQFHQLQLNNKYGKFAVDHSLETQGKSNFFRGYETNIAMTPNEQTRRPIINTKFTERLTKGSDTDHIQTVRSGTNDNWRTTARDHGWNGQIDESGQPINSEGKEQFIHRAELTEQETGTGWRVDQQGKNKPFHGETHNGSVGRHHSRGETEIARLYDKPSIVEPGFQFDAMTTAMDKKTGKEFGTVRWGYRVGRNEQGESILNTRTPTFLEDDLNLEGAEGEEAREWDRGRKAAYEQWNRAAPGKEQFNIEDNEKRLRSQKESLANQQDPEQKQAYKVLIRKTKAERRKTKKVTRIPGID